MKKVRLNVISGIPSFIKIHKLIWGCLTSRSFPLISWETAHLFHLTGNVKQSGLLLSQTTPIMINETFDYIERDSKSSKSNLFKSWLTITLRFCISNVLYKYRTKCYQSKCHHFELSWLQSSDTYDLEIFDQKRKKFRKLWVTALYGDVELWPKKKFAEEEETIWIFDVMLIFMSNTI